jgi:integrase
MASFQKRTNGDGSKAVLAWVRIKPFKPASRSFPNLADAKTWAKDLEDELRKQRKQGDVRKDLTALTIGDLIKAYLADPETTALNTYDDVERLLSWWINHFGAEKIMAFGAVKLREARDLLRNGRANGTVNRYLSALRSCWSWGRAAQYVPVEKVWPTRLFLSEPQSRVRFLDDEELAAARTAAENHSPWMHAAVLTSLATGLRQGELLRLQWKDIDLTKKTVVVLISKTKKRRIVHLPTPAVVALKKLRRDGVLGPARVFVHTDGTPIDKSRLRVQWIEVRKAAGLVDFHWHDLRHSCASYLAQNGASLVEIGSVLGHTNPSTTAKYAHLVAGRPVTGADKLAEKLS